MPRILTLTPVLRTINQNEFLQTRRDTLLLRGRSLLALAEAVEPANIQSQVVCFEFLCVCVILCFLFKGLA